jgi:catechol 2,3-dioxygenase-like lactoylglutathione lyase family enzyme
MRHVRLIFMLVTLCAPVETYAPPKRAEISGIAFVRLRVTNIEDSRKFYGELLKLSASSGWCFRAEATCYPLSLIQELEILPAGGPARSNMVDAIGFWVDDVHKLRSYIAARGVKSEKVISNSSAEECIGVRDSENHQIVFISLSGGVMGSLRSSPARVSDRLIHAGIIVRDRVAEDHFYKDILGFHAYWHGGRKDDETSWVDMQVPNGTDWIEYMLNVPANADHHTLGVMNHIALGVSDIHAAEAQLRKNGWSGNEQPKIGRDGKWQLNLYDPDDTRVELMEFTPTQKPCCSEYIGPHPGQHP